MTTASPRPYPRYTVALMCSPCEHWAVWDRTLRREVSHLCPDRPTVAAWARALNASTAEEVK
jgi:hypothetical protein